MSGVARAGETTPLVNADRDCGEAAVVGIAMQGRGWRPTMPPSGHPEGEIGARRHRSFPADAVPAGRAGATTDKSLTHNTLAVSLAARGGRLRNGAWLSA